MEKDLFMVVISYPGLVIPGWSNNFSVDCNHLLWLQVRRGGLLCQRRMRLRSPLSKVFVIEQLFCYLPFFSLLPSNFLCESMGELVVNILIFLFLNYTSNCLLKTLSP